MESLLHLYKRAKPYLGVIFLQVGYAANGLIVKSALNQGMNPYTFSVYRNVIATAAFGPFAMFFERKLRPVMTISIFFNIMLLGLLEPVLDQILYYMGMKYTTATFAIAMCNILPAITFLMAGIFRVLGAIIIVLGLYLIIWGKSKDPSLSDFSRDQVELLDQKAGRNDATKTSKLDLDSISREGTSDEAV